VFLQMRKSMLGTAPQALRLRGSSLRGRHDAFTARGPVEWAKAAVALQFDRGA
jgi:hypothetical protein